MDDQAPATRMKAVPRRRNFYKAQQQLWFPVLRSVGFTDLRMAPHLRLALAPEMRTLEGIHAQGSLERRASILALRTVRSRPEADPYWTARQKRQITFSFLGRDGVPASWGDFFDHGIRTRYYCYGWESEEGGTLDTWAVVDIDALRRLDPEEVPLSIGSIRGGRSASFVAVSLRRLCNAAESTELVPYYSVLHPSFT